MAEFETDTTDVITKHLESSERVFDAYAILEWYDGIIQAIALRHDLRLALVLTARFSQNSNYLYSVADLPYERCHEWLQMSFKIYDTPSGDKSYIVRASENEVNALIEKATSLDMMLEMGELGGKYGKRWAIKRVWGSRVPWY